MPPNPSLSYFWQHESQIFRFWPFLTPKQKKVLEKQLSHIQIDVLKEQQRLIQAPRISIDDTFESFNDFKFSGDLQNQQRGQQLIEKGKLGCLLLAGGQGTRLQHIGTKGTYPISVIKHKTLFQLCAEKVKKASQKASHLLNLAIMTSSESYEETVSFFQHHQFFGLAPSQLSFFIQETLPLLDNHAKLFLKTPYEVNVGADGNGYSLFYFAKSGILDQWLQQGIEYMHVILVDNPLADPFDAELLGFHQQQKSEITLKCTEKINPEEKVGVLVKQNHHYQVIEYSEMSDHEKNQKRPEGSLKHCCANLSLFCFSLSFIQSLVKQKKTLPLHKAWKAAQYADQEGISHFSSQPMAWKFETFIFDWLFYAQRVSALIYPREQCFAPLKNFKGADSPETVRKALQQADKRVIQSVTGLTPPSFPFELAADFYYPTPELRAKWQGQPITTSYIEP